MDNGWPKWFADRIKQYPSPEAYYLDCANYISPLVSHLRSIIPPPASLIEVGCGLGVSASVFASQGYTVTAIDNDTQILQLAHEMPWIATRSGSMQFECREAFNLPRGYDIATSLGIIEHEPQLIRIDMLAELVHAARYALVSIPSKWINANSRDMGENDISLSQLRNECRMAGWHILSSFGWGIPNQFRHLFYSVPPLFKDMVQRKGLLSCSLCVIGRSVIPHKALDPVRYELA